MSRTKKGSKGIGHEFWGRRPIDKNGHSNKTRKNKRVGIQRERAVLKQQTLRLSHEVDYDEREYEAPCDACRKGICPVFDINGKQVGVNGDYNI